MLFHIKKKTTVLTHFCQLLAGEVARELSEKESVYSTDSKGTIRNISHTLFPPNNQKLLPQGWIWDKKNQPIGAT